jgi:peptidoglycan-associated lipoprotein
MQIKLSIAAFAVIAALSGCATTDDQSATVEDKSPIAGSQSAAATSTGVAGGMGAGQSLGADARDTAAAGRGRPDLKRSVYFEFDRYDVKPEYRPLVETHARWLRANPTARLTIEGNSDERGSREYNVALGQRRAESVTSLMVTMGVKPQQIEAVSFGKEKPRAEGHDEAAWSENRRSDFATR